MKVNQLKAHYENQVQIHVENIYKSLECYQCSDIPGPNKEKRFSCHDHSHQLCAQCSNSACKCGSPVMDVPNSVVEILLQNLPFFCGNYKRKCRQNFHEVEALKDHEKICQFRLIICPSRMCLENSAASLECFKCENIQ